MSILGNKHNLLLEDEIEEVQEEYELPAVVRKSQEDMPLKKSLIISTLLHPTVVGLIAMILFVLALLGITLSIFERPQPKMNDIEFVLVDKEQAPINQNTKYRSDKNSRAGGIHDPKRKVSMPSPSPKKSVKKSASSAVSPAKTKKAVNKPFAQNKAKSTPKKVVQKSPTPNKSNARPQPPSARPSLKPTAPKLSSNPKPQFAVPVPKTNLPQGSRSSGPVGGTGSARTSGGGSYAPVPSLSPSMGSGSGSSGSRMARGGSGSGQYGNPGPGNPNGAPGIDAIREPDFGPYMRELQRKIKMNWDPPRGNESKRVVLLFKIARDGRLLSTRVFKSSGLPNADKAALNAVSLSAPFRPLPPAFKGQSIDIQFTFDYNVFGAKQY